MPSNSVTPKALVAVWALAAIAVANQGNNLLVVISTVMAAIILVNIITGLIIGRKRKLVDY